MQHAAIFGLVLCGGKSSRMQRDKAALDYHGQSQLEHAVQLLASVTAKVYVSVRADQTDDPLRRRYPQIVDRAGVTGPMAGILAAFDNEPNAAWLVLACDLPLLERDTLEYLLAERDPTQLATAFRSHHDGLPEPLCALYEPAAAPALREQWAAGKACPRKFLLQHPVALLTLPNPRALDNANTGAEYSAIMQALNATNPIERRLRIEYFAILREQAGQREEELTSTAATAADLYRELAARHTFTLDIAMLRVAINGEFAPWDQPLQAGDAVVFIPPVAGG